MRIQPVGHTLPTQVRHASTAATARGQGPSRDTRMAPADPVDATIAPISDDDRGVEPAEKVRGVIRNLEAGHFKGVADVRLRINFFDELAARASERAQSTAAAESQQFVRSVSEQVDQLVATLAIEDAKQQEAVAELVSQFDTAVQDAVADFTGSDDGLAGLNEAVNLAFDALVEGLREVLAPAPLDPTNETDETPLDPGPATGTDPATPEPETTDALGIAARQLQPLETYAATSDDAVGAVDTTGVTAAPSDPIAEQPDPPTDPVDPSVTTFDDALASFVTAFGAALADFLGNIETSYTLPDPAPYGGNGGAYAKFLAIYDQLRGLDDSGVDALG